MGKEGFKFLCRANLSKTQSFNLERVFKSSGTKFLSALRIENPLSFDHCQKSGSYSLFKPRGWNKRRIIEVSIKTFFHHSFLATFINTFFPFSMW